MKKVMFGVVTILITMSTAHAVLIGFFPGLDELIEKADAIVILRVDHHVDVRYSETLYTTHDCYVYQTLKGDIPTHKRILLRLMDTRTSFATPFVLHSTHLMFLTKTCTPNEPTDFQTIPFHGANVRLPPFGHENKPEGKTIAEQVRVVLRIAADRNKKEYEKEQAFLNQIIKGTAESTHSPVK
jgi:hypothetical protein